MNLLDQIEKLPEGQFFCLSEDERILAVTDDKYKIPLMISEEYCGVKVTIDKVTFIKHDYSYEIEATLLEEGDEEANEYDFIITTICKY